MPTISPLLIEGEVWGVVAVSVGVGVAVGIVVTVEIDTRIALELLALATVAVVRLKLLEVIDVFEAIDAVEVVVGGSKEQVIAFWYTAHLDPSGQQPKSHTSRM